MIKEFQVIIESVMNDFLLVFKFFGFLILFFAFMILIARIFKLESFIKDPKPKSKIQNGSIKPE